MAFTSCMASSCLGIGRAERADTIHTCRQHCLNTQFMRPTRGCFDAPRATGRDWRRPGTQKTRAYNSRHVFRGCRHLFRGQSMRSHRLATGVGALVLSVSALLSAAPPSEVADATMRGDRAALRALLQRKADVNVPQVDGATALHWAVYRDDLDAADLLLKAGAKLDVANPEGITPIALACLYGNVSMINRLVKAGADVKQRGPNGQTLLMLAARNGQPETINLLVAAGADVNARETLRNTTALMWAAEQRHPAAVKALLDAGADAAAKSGPA